MTPDSFHPERSRPRPRLSGAGLVTLCLGAMSMSGVEHVSAQAQVTEASIRQLQEAMELGETTSVAITEAYLARIEAFDANGPRLNAILRLNPDALAEAEALDRERARTGPRGPLHGIPILLKDNYDTFDMPTSAGTLALAGLVPPDDAFQVRKLREAGAVILGKTNLHELASGITTISSLGGQTLNPYDPTRNPGGSSGGTGAAIAASFAAVGWGSDTCGSIRIPAAHNNLVGLRPTKGLSSIDGIIPLSHTQDVGGPLARTVEDLAIALNATIGPDPADPATSALEGRELPDFVAALDPDALDGARIGIFEPLYGDDPEDAAVGAVVRAAVRRMEALGATVVSVEMPSYAEVVAGSGLIGHEFKWDLADYLSGVPDAPVRTLGELIERGLVHDAIIGVMRRWDEPTERDSEEYRAALDARERLIGAILAEMDAQNVDALAYPSIRRIAAHVGDPQPGSACQLSAQTGLPAMALPAGWSSGLPVGMELLGRPFDDARLVAFAYAYERANDLRRTPELTPATEMPVLVRNAQVLLMGSAFRVAARFSYLEDGDRMSYEAVIVSAQGTGAPDYGGVHALVLTHADEDGRPSVAARLIGPGRGAGVGEIDLDARLHEELEDGSVFLELVTAGPPDARMREPVDGWTVTPVDD